jgi:hypothetical protein
MPLPNPELIQKICDLSDGKRNAQEIADLVGKSKSHVQAIIRKIGLPKVEMKKGFALNPKHRSKENQKIVQKIVELADGVMTSKEISIAVGKNQKYVQDVMNKLDLPRRPQGGPTGTLNGSFRCGRHIDFDGYVLVSSPGHPFGRMNGKNVGRVYEHRLVMERVLGRYLKPCEVVDHIDGIHLHNSPDNLRLFASNADHLKATISGQVPFWSEAGLRKMKIPPAQRKGLKPVDTYYQRRKRGDVRLQQILLAWLSLDKDSPYLLGTRHWLVKAGISDFSRQSLQLRLLEICPQCGDIRSVSKP